MTEISTSHVSKSEVSKQPTHSQGLVNTFLPLEGFEGNFDVVATGGRDPAARGSRLAYTECQSS